LLADGFHRVRAHELAGRTEIEVEVRKGDRRAALLFAAGANATHGARRTNQDKRRAVMALLADPEWAKKSPEWVAEQCGVSRPFVYRVRDEQGVTVTPSATVEGRDGKTYPGRKRKPKRKANPARALKVARRGLDAVARAWPKGEDVGPLVEAGRAWLGTLEGSKGKLELTRPARGSARYRGSGDGGRGRWLSGRGG
jgi:hypothetical protein